VASAQETGFDLVLFEGAEDSGRNEQDRGDCCRTIHALVVENGAGDERSARVPS